MNGLKIALPLCFTLVLGCATKPQSDTNEMTSPAGVATPAPAQTPSTSTAPKPKAPRTRTDPPPKPDIECTKPDDTRLLEIEEVHSGCWLFYVNRGIKKRIAWSKTGNMHCEKVRDQIRVSLEKGGYQCKWK